jgi:hypothetical protein
MIAMIMMMLIMSMMAMVMICQACPSSLLAKWIDPVAGSRRVIDQQFEYAYPVLLLLLRPSSKLSPWDPSSWYCRYRGCIDISRRSRRQTGLTNRNTTR